MKALTLKIDIIRKVVINVEVVTAGCVGPVPGHPRCCVAGRPPASADTIPGNHWTPATTAGLIATCLCLYGFLG